jgi:hypothetical protein
MSEQKRKYCKGDGFDAWWEDRSIPQKILVGIGFGFLGIGLIALFGLVVMLLWNWLMPAIFDFKQVDFWQACSLLALCTILFKGMHFRDDSQRTDRKRRRQLRSYLQESQTADGNTMLDSSQS